MTQKALYPLTVMRVTQDEYAPYSHAGSPAHDNGGASSATDDITRAPYDGYVARVRNGSSHETYFVSNAPVLQADGTVGILTTRYMHDNVLDVRVGQRLKRGEKIGNEGGFGGGRKDSFARHVHLEVARGKQLTQTRNKYGTYVISGAISLHKAFFVAADTTIINGAGHAWQRTSETLLPSKVPETGKPTLDPTKPLRMTVIAASCEYFAARDLDKPLGKLALDTMYDVLEYSPQAVAIGTLRGHWVRYAMASGAEYYALALPDRTRLDNVAAAYAPAIGDTVRATAVLNVRTAPGTSRALLCQMRQGDTGKVADIDGNSCYLAGKGWVVVSGVDQAVG